MDAARWNRWETGLREVLTHPNLLEHIKANGELGGHLSPSGRFTYAKIADASNFGAFSDVVVNMTLREETPNIAHVLLKGNVYRRKLVVFSSIEEEDFENETDDMVDELQILIDTVRDGKPIGGLCTLENEHVQISHGIAFVAWKDRGVFHFAFYDPLSYQRRRVRKDGTVYMVGYNYAAMTFQNKWFESIDVPIQFWDLSNHCMRTEKEGEFHCPQYVMDAEYCFMNSLYFLYKWVHLGKPIGDALERVVEACYISEPASLKRTQSMVYRVVMMSFILTTLRAYFTKTSGKWKWPKEWLTRIENKEQTWLNTYAIPLMPSAI